MTKLPSSQKIINTLIKNGFIFISQRGSHLKYRKADKNGIIYAITNPNGETYIGMSEMYLKARMTEHRKHYKQYKQGKRNSLPGLHKSIDKFGWKNHNIQTLLELEDIDRKQLEYIESSFIASVKQTGKSLNIRK